MSVYMLTPIDDPDRLERVVKKVFPNEGDTYLLSGKTACFVKFGGTMEELARLLDLPGGEKTEDRPFPAIVTLVTTFGGFGPSSLWEWINRSVLA